MTENDKKKISAKMIELERQANNPEEVRSREFFRGAYETLNEWKGFHVEGIISRLLKENDDE